MIDLYQEDDDTIEAEEHDEIEVSSLQQIPSERSSRKRIAPAASLAEMDQIQHESGPRRLYLQLRALRRVISEEESLNAGDVLNDTTIEMLSTTCPQDTRAFKTVIEEVMKDYYEDESQARVYVEDKWTRYGSQFLDLCIKHTIEDGPAISRASNFTARRFNSTDMQERFSYNDPSSSSSASKPTTSARHFKFKKPLD